MKYSEKGHFESLTWLLLNSLVWVGIFGIIWNLLKSGGWLSWIIDFIVRNQPTSVYYLAAGVLGLLVGKVWLDKIDPSAIYDMLTVTWAFAGTFFILGLLLPLL